MKELESSGVELLEEVIFSPYCVDIYIPKYHMVIEVDGPHHMKKKDSTRDAVLRGKYKLHVVHIKHDARWEDYYPSVYLEMKSAQIDKEERWERSKRKTPWL